MLSKKLKKVILGFVTALCLTGSAMPVMADTVRFNVTVPGDPKSKRIPKSDDEQKFYVTGTYFSSYGTLSCRSYQLENQHVFIKNRIASELPPDIEQILDYLCSIRENIKAGQNLMYIISCHHIRV